MHFSTSTCKQDLILRNQVKKPARLCRQQGGSIWRRRPDDHMIQSKKKKVTDNNYLKKSIQFHLQVKTASRVNIVSALKRVKTAELKGDKQDSENQTVIKSTARYYYLHLFS